MKNNFNWNSQNLLTNFRIFHHKHQHLDNNYTTSSLLSSLHRLVGKLCAHVSLRHFILFPTWIRLLVKTDQNSPTCTNFSDTRWKEREKHWHWLDRQSREFADGASAFSFASAFQLRRIFKLRAKHRQFPYQKRDIVVLCLRARYYWQTRQLREASDLLKFPLQSA